MNYKHLLDMMSKNRYFGDFVAYTTDDLLMQVNEWFLNDDEEWRVELVRNSWIGQAEYVYDNYDVSLRPIVDVVDEELEALNLFPFKMDSTVLYDFFSWKDEVKEEVGYMYIYFLYKIHADSKRELIQLVYTNSKIEIEIKEDYGTFKDDEYEIVELNDFFPIQFYTYNFLHINWSKAHVERTYRHMILSLVDERCR